MENLQDRSRGALLGLAIGDALGAQVEFDFADDIRAREKAGKLDLNEMRAGGSHHLPKGAYTDDTSMALCLADSLLETKGYDSANVMEKYDRWYRDGYRSSVGVCFDIGQQTYTAIERFTHGKPIVDKNEMTKSAGNGGIMRLAPAVIASAHQPIENAMKLAMISSRETHYSAEANAGAAIFGAMIWRALHAKDGADKRGVVNVASFSTGKVFDDIFAKINSILQKDFTHYGLEDLGGYVVDALKIATWGFVDFDNFRDGLLAVIRLGGDTDTNGAIYGQLAGAYYGANAIPESWRHDVIDRDEIVKLADQLSVMKNCPIIKTRFSEDRIH